jgi:hypothetical protein
MTFFSLQALVTFLNKYQNELKTPVGDFGGSLKSQQKAVRKVQGKKVAKNFIKNTSTVQNVLASGGITDYQILDFATGFDLLKPIKGKKFGLGICMDMLEHVTQPFIVAKNISNSLKKGALLFVTVPFIWEIHDHPGDYFRYTPQGLAVLFPSLKCLELFMVRDEAADEAVPRARVVGIFRKN